MHAFRGRQFIEYGNPFDVGMTSLLGFSSAYHAMMNCDTLLMIGTDFPYRQFLPKEATVVQIDVRGEQPGRRSKVDFCLVGQRITRSLSKSAPGSGPDGKRRFRQETYSSTICREHH